MVAEVVTAAHEEPPVESEDLIAQEVKCTMKELAANALETQGKRRWTTYYVRRFKTPREAFDQ